MSREFKYKDVLLAWMDGKDIQYTTSSAEWRDYKGTEVPNVVCCIFEWRIKPEKRTVWVNIYKNCSGTYWTGGIVFADEESARSRSHNPSYITTISIEEEIV